MIEITIGSVSSNTAGTITSDTPASDAAQQLREPTIPALVVLDERDHVTGIVTESDFVALVAETHDSVDVDAIMSTPVITALPDTPIGLAADRMRDAGVKHLPIVDDGVYRGLVSLSSLAPFLSRARLDVIWKGEPISLDTAASSEPVATDQSSNRGMNS